MGYNFTEQNYIFVGFLGYNDEKRIQIAWTSWIATF